MVAEAAGPSPAEAGEPPAFKVAAASFAVDGRTLLHPIDLTVPPGSFVGLIGHNGSGKSTFLKLLARQQEATAGAISYGGRRLADWSGREFAQRVAYLPQAIPAATGLTVAELVAFGRYPWRGAFAPLGATDRAAIAAATARCGLDAMADRLVDTLSGGERQRAWLAMLVAQDARFLLLDEPVSALDLGQQVDVLTLLHDLARHEGKGVVAVLHDVNMAARFCDEIVALRGGSLMVRGAPDAIMRTETLERIYDLPMHVLPHPEGGARIAVPR